MALSAVSVDNFRAFARPTTLDIRPLTLVFGYNSRGKSSLVRALPLLADSTRRDAAGPLDTRSEAVRGATFVELKSAYGRSATVGFGLSWDDDASEVARLEVRILGGGFQAIEWVERLEAYSRNGARLLQLLLKDEVNSLYEVTGAAWGELEAPFAFQGLVPALAEGAQLLPEQAAAALRGVRERLLSLTGSIHWLSAVRTVPPRRSEFRGKPPRIREDGSGAAEQLAYANSRDRAVVDEVRAFYRKATSHDLNVEEVAIGAVPGFTLTLSSLEGPDFRVNLIDTGEGMAQVLPVAVLGALAKHGRLDGSPTVVVEHPELHLHPRAHEEVAWFLTQVVASSNARFIVETHSENFLSRVQLSVLRGEIDPKHVIVHWVWQHEAGSSVESIELDADARFIGDKWPPGVFSEDTLLARQILAERRKRAGAS
ncbi:AAA family ATPase [Sorangium sp. So ce363]|uniref:AAA family ATPase n=1 Tax=Sorangium sp. So ce363 TaxID=3133304 RepID=UPI003F5D96EB